MKEVKRLVLRYQRRFNGSFHAHVLLSYPKRQLILLQLILSNYSLSLSYPTTAYPKRQTVLPRILIINPRATTRVD